MDPGLLTRLLNLKLKVKYHSVIWLFNDHDGSNYSLFYMKERQVKMEWGESKRGRKREREKQIKSVGDRV